MQNNHSNGTCASFARGFAALWGVLAMGLGLMASPAEAAPFAVCRALAKIAQGRAAGSRTAGQ